MRRHLAGLWAVLAGVLFASAWAAADDKNDDGTSCTLLIFNSNALADEKDWVQLFNGKNLAGWKLHPQPNKREIAEVIPKTEDGRLVAFEGKLKKGGKVVPLWRVEDGILIGSGPHSHLFTERDDF